MAAEELYYVACKRYDSLENELRVKGIIDLPKKLFVTAYLQGISDINRMKNSNMKLVFDRVENF
jgi:hypothetical protein